MSSLLYGTFREPLTDRPARRAVGAPSFGVFQSLTFRKGSSPVVRRGCIGSSQASFSRYAGRFPAGVGLTCPASFLLEKLVQAANALFGLGE